MGRLHHTNTEKAMASAQLSACKKIADISTENELSCRRIARLLLKRNKMTSNMPVRVQKQPAAEFSQLGKAQSPHVEAKLRNRSYAPGHFLAQQQAYSNRRNTFCYTQFGCTDYNTPCNRRHFNTITYPASGTSPHPFVSLTQNFASQLPASHVVNEKIHLQNFAGKALAVSKCDQFMR